MRVIVCGGRDYNDRAEVWRVLSDLPLTEIIHGGATGADTLAHEYGIAAGIKVSRHMAQWKVFGPAAGPIRNSIMLGFDPDRVIAFPGGKGTADMVRKAQAKGIPVTQVWPAKAVDFFAKPDTIASQMEAE